MLRQRLAAVLFAVIGFSSVGPSRAAESPPNVVLIVGDDQAWFDFGFMGSRDISTPHLDRLAEQSAVFTRAYGPTSVCNPSLATILTGRYPHESQIGIRLETPPPPADVARERFRLNPTIPALLGKKGYVSLQTGKWWEGDYRLAGFTHGMTTGQPVEGSALANAHKPVPGKSLRPLDKGMLYMAGAEGIRIGREGLEPIYNFIRQRDEHPFFVWYAPMLPHTPHNPPQRLYDKYQVPGRPETVARYMAMCEWFDETVGELLAFLDREKLSDNTLVAFVIDNGYIPHPEKETFAPKSKLSPYDAGLRTPIMLRWPNHIRPARYDTLVHTIDLAPTIEAACGVEQPAGLPGINLLDVCAGKPVERDTIFGALFSSPVKEPRVPADTLSYRWCVAREWKLIVPKNPQAARELYNVIADPHEENNLAARDPERVQQLQGTIDRWWPAAAK